MRRERTTVATALLLLFVSAAGCGAEGGDGAVKSEDAGVSGEVRRPVVAGSFYPGDAASLGASVDRYLADAEVVEIDGEPMALIAPHAGYMYSGGVAGNAYAHLRGRAFDTVIVVAPSHRFPFRTASVYGGEGYATPLGVVPVDRELASAISGGRAEFAHQPRAHSGEHSLEVQVPFLQRTLEAFSIVPIVLGDQSEPAVRVLATAMADAIKGAGGKKVLLVASTDLSHYHTHDEAVRLDSHVLDAVGAFDPEGLLASLARGECEACGGGPAAAVMMAARELGATGAKVVGYATSGDVTGERSQVVGYMAAVVHGPARERAGAGAEEAAERAEESAPYTGLTDDERHVLLRLARASIEAAVSGGRPPEPDRMTPALSTECGAFVTLEKRGSLRGCIGHIRAVKPLAQTVAEMAVQAALHDPRFPSVTEEELPDLTVEISVMSPLEVVRDVSEIEVGRDGLVIQDGMRSGLLLPQVATDYGWDRDTFLEHTCMKAGLPPDAWKNEGVTILRFTAEVFGEE